MARGEAPDKRCGEGAGNDEIATGAPAANGNGPAKVYRHKGE